MISLIIFAYAIQLQLSAGQERVTLCDNLYDFGSANSAILYAQAFIPRYNVTVITSGNTLHFLTSQNTQAYPPLLIGASANCPHVYASEDFIIAGCYHNDGKAYLLRFNCSASSCKQFGQEAEFTVSIKQLYKIAQAENTLIVLQPEKVFLFKLAFTTSSWNIQGLPQILDSEYFYRTSLNLTDFEVQFMNFTGDYQYKIMLLDQQQDIFWVDSVIRSNYLLPYIWGNIYVKSLYAIKPATFLQLIDVTHSLLDQDKKTIILHTLIATDAENTYLFKATYTLYSNKTTIGTMSTETMPRYSTWKFIKQVPVLDTYVAIPYQYNTGDKIRISIFVLSQYKMDDPEYFSVSDFIKSKLQQRNQETILGATAKDYVNIQYSENFFMYFIQRDNKIYLNYQDVTIDNHRVVTQCELIGY